VLPLLRVPIGGTRVPAYNYTPRHTTQKHSSILSQAHTLQCQDKHMVADCARIQGGGPLEQLQLSHLLLHSTFLPTLPAYTPPPPPPMPPCSPQGTPIGNLEDMSFRAIRILQGAHLILAEDTRHTRKLLEHYAIRTPTLSCHEHNERQRQELVLQRLQQGEVSSRQVVLPGAYL